MKKTIALLALALLTTTTTFTVLAESNKSTQEKTIKLDLNDGTNFTKTIKSKSEFPLNDIVEPYRKGYTFKGWMLNDNLVPRTTFIKNDVQLKAKWEKSFEVTFNQGEDALLRSNKVENVEAKTSLKKPFDPFKKGYKFIGWFDGEVKIDFPYTPTKDVELTAKYQKEYFLVTLNLNGGSGVDTKVLVPNGERLIGLLEPKLENKTFDKWQLNGADFSFDTEITQDIQLDATYRNGNLITFKYNDKGKTENKVVELLPDDVTQKPEDPELKNHKFLGWFDEDGREFTFGEKLTKSVELTARWEQLAFSVKFIVPEGSTFEGEKELTLNKEELLTKPAQDPTLTDGEFEGWFDGDTKFEGFDKPVTKDLELVAKFSIKVTVSFVKNITGEEETVSQVKINKGEKVTKPEEVPTKDGYDFEGWYFDELPFNFDNAINSSIKVYAQFSKRVTLKDTSLNHPFSPLVLSFEDLNPTSEFSSEQNPDGNIINTRVLEEFSKFIEGVNKPNYFKYRENKLEMYFDKLPSDGDILTFKQGFPVYKYSKDGEYYRIGSAKEDLKLKKIDGKYIFISDEVKDKTLEYTIKLKESSTKNYAVLSDAKTVLVQKNENTLVITVTYSTESSLSFKLYETKDPKENNKIDAATEEDKLLLSKELDQDHVKLASDVEKFVLLEGLEEALIKKAEDNQSLLTIFFTTTVDLADKNPKVWYWGLNDVKFAGWGLSPEFTKVSTKDGKHMYMITIEVLEKDEAKGLTIYTEGSDKFTGDVLSIESISAIKTYKTGNNLLFVESNELKPRTNDQNDGVNVTLELSK